MALPADSPSPATGSPHAPHPSSASAFRSRALSFARRRPLTLALALAFAISLPALGAGFFSDDYSMVLLIEHKIPTSEHALDLYRFSDGTTEAVTRYRDHGPFPWWTLPHLKLAFWRPLSSLLLVADHALFGRHMAGYHLDSIVWYLLFCAAAIAVLRRALPAAAVPLAAILFAVNDSHVQAAGWISNRHSEVAAAISLVGLWAHIRSRERGAGMGGLLSLAAFAVAFTAGETALATLGYLIAYELVGRTDSLGRRLLALAPAGALTAIYLAAYRQMGYGAWGSAGYIDPVGAPGAFLRAAPERILALAGGLFGPIPADLLATHPELRPLVCGAGLVALPLFGGLLARALKHAPPEDRRAMRWLVAGGFISLVPTLGGLPGNRLLLLPSLAGVAVVAVIVRHARGSWSARAPMRLALGALVFFEVVRPPVAFVATLGYLGHLSREGETIARDMELPPSDQADVADVALLAASDMIVAFYSAPVHKFHTDRFPRSWWILSMAAHDHEARRTGPHTLELRVVGGRMLERTFETLLRDPAAHPLSAGNTVVLGGMTVRVLEAEDGQPTRIEARFDRPLDDVWLLAWQGGALRHVTLPESGTPMFLEREPGPLEQ